MAENTDTTPQINFLGKVLAGGLLISATAFSIMVIIAFLPDKLPKAGGEACALYQYKWFNMKLASAACPPQDTIQKDSGIVLPLPRTHDDSVKARFADSLNRAQQNTDSLKARNSFPCKVTKNQKFIHLNTILLVLVVAGGFLGNMIHIASSFTVFVGARKFEQSWILWYWVRPFTAAALALAVYFAFGATNDPGTADIDRIITLSILSGLFTDRATEKLREFFEVLFKPKNNRPNKLTDPDFSIDSAISPAALIKGTENTVVIKGQKLTNKKLTIKIEETVIAAPTIKDDSISFAYTIPDADAGKDELTLLISDEAGTELLKKSIPVNQQPATAPGQEEAGTDEEADEKPLG